jgi:hypothetical protein
MCPELNPIQRACRAAWMMGLWVLLTLPASQAQASPALNLLVEWRIGGQASSQVRQSGIQSGRVIIDSRRGVIGQAGVSYGTTQIESSGHSVQQVMVLNGGRARLFFGSTQMVTTWQWAWTPGGATGGQPGDGAQASSFTVVPQTVRVDLGQGLVVAPRWPGGRAPVTVELEARSSEPAQPGSIQSGQIDADGQIRRSELSSTVSVPLGEWTVVARNAGQSSRAQSARLSTRDVDESRSEQLEIRISVP